MIQAKIKEKMKKLFVDIIPEEQWDHIVKTEHDKFVEMELVNMQQNRY